MNETISVIIPVYKVEPYLRKCLDSVLNQTYTNLEVILVDDGSPDNCPSICDEYAAKDPRIKVIHKKNGGVASARNTGLAAASGEYIAFADPDDHVAPEWLRILHHELIFSHADICSCGFYYGDPPLANWKERGPQDKKILSSDEAIRLLIADDELQNYLWNKLYRRHLWQGLTFPEGRRFEDVSLMWKLVLAAEKVCLVPDALYFYCMRNDSIVHGQSFVSEVDCALAELERFNTLGPLYPDTKEEMISRILHSLVKVWGLAWKNRRLIREEYTVLMAQFSDFARQYTQQSSYIKELGITGRITVLLLPSFSLVAFGAAHLLNRLYRIKHRIY